MPIQRFANGGIRCAPLFVTKIEDSHGNVIAKFQPLMTEVISEVSSYQMIDMLRAVIQGGTGSRLRYAYHLTADIGGKTGTTNNNSDGWFMGITPELVSGCWVVVKIAISTSTTHQWVKVLQQPCQYGLTYAACLCRQTIRI